MQTSLSQRFRPHRHVFTTLAATAAIFFASAGTLRLFRAGSTTAALGTCLSLGCSCVSTGAAEVVNERGRSSDVKAWDKAFGVAYAALSRPAGVAGLDLRLRGATCGVGAGPASPRLLAYAVSHWAMVVNRFLETGFASRREGHWS